MITSLRRDILLTLLIKFSLLTLLWFICFKNVEKPSKDTIQWLLGPTSQQKASLSKLKL